MSGRVRCATPYLPFCGLDFLVQVPEAFVPVLDRHGERATLALGQALAVSFGWRYPSPVRVRLRPGPRAALLAVGGRTLRIPDPMEVDGWIAGVLVAAAVLAPGGDGDGRGR